MDRETTILLVDDHPVLRKGLGLLIAQEPDLRVVGEAGDGKAAIDLARDLSPDVVVMDITMPDVNGIEATRHIVSESPGTKVMALSIHSGKRFVEDMLRAGAAGYVLKDSAPEELVNGIRTVMRGEVYLSAAIAGVVVSQYMHALSHAEAVGEDPQLTARESDILRLVVEGNSAEQIATVLHIRPRTVESARRRLMKKLGLKSIAELSEYARTNKGLAGKGPSEPASRHATEARTDSDRILRTKLHRPSPAPDLVPRSRLLQELEKHRSQPVTLVSAGAGYGKSTLVSSWLAACDCPSVWMSLDEDDNDLRQFLSCFLAAIQTMFPAAGQATQALLNAPSLPPLSSLARELLSDLDQIDEAFILVVDDYHRIDERAVHDLLTNLLDHPPRAMHLVLLTRRDPPLPLSTLRGRGQLNEISTSQLRFTRAETAAFLEKTLKASVDDNTVTAIDERIEGWAAGLRLMVHSLSSREDLDRLLPGLRGPFASVVDYLVDEVLSRQPPAVATCLRKTAILDRFCAPLCQALCAPNFEPGENETGGHGFINWLQANNLFLIALDTEAHWFRYHQLFRQLLQNQLESRFSTEEMAALHSRASAWFEDQGLIEEAIDHSLAGGDAVGAARIVERNRLAALDREQWHVLATWLARLPDEIKQQRLELLLAQAWVAYQQFRLIEIRPILDRAKALSVGDSPDASLRGELDFLQGYLSFWQGEAARSLKLFERALARVPESPAGWVRADIELFVGLALYVSGQKETAVRTLSEGIQSRRLPEGMLWTRLVFGLAVVRLLDGELAQSSWEAQRLGVGARRIGDTFVETWSSYLQGIASFHSFDLNVARGHFCQAAKQLHIHHSRAAIDNLAALAVTCQLMGQPDEADRTAERAQEFAEWTNDPSKLQIARSCRARLALLRNDLDSAVHWQRSSTDTPNVPSMIFFSENPCITECRVLVAAGSDASLREATERLENLWQAARALHYTCQMMEIVVLQALATHRQGRLGEALEVLEQAVVMATPGGWIRPFVELGPPMAALLMRLLEEKPSVDFTRQILAVFGDDQHGGVPAASDAQGARRTTSYPALIEPLTNREQEVLELLALRLSDKEIAEKLFVSTETVKSHVKHVHQKLHVSNRRQAVAKATELGILTSH